MSQLVLLCPLRAGNCLELSLTDSGSVCPRLLASWVSSLPPAWVMPGTGPEASHAYPQFQASYHPKYHLQWRKPGPPPEDLVGRPSHIMCRQGPAHVTGMPHPPSSPSHALVPSKSKSVSPIGTLTSFCPCSCEKGLAVCLILEAVMDESTHTSHPGSLRGLPDGLCSTDYWKVCPTSSSHP